METWDAITARRNVRDFEGIGGAEVADGLIVPIQLGTFGTKVGGDTAKFYAELEKGLGRNAH